MKKSLNKTKNYFFFLETYETILDEPFQYYYRIINNKLEITNSYGEPPEFTKGVFSSKLDANPIIKILQSVKLVPRFNLKIYLTPLLKEAFEYSRLYDGLPTYSKSPIYSEDEFNAIIQEMRDELASIIGKAQQSKTPFIEYLDEIELRPQPTGYSETSWIAKCPNTTGSHFICVSTSDDEWGCPYCRRKGNQDDLDKWIEEIKIRKAGNRS